ncbi:MAG: pseudouridine synthase [Candidatus Nanoarchaeia archaeon]|nr:pseudouridine synthase [Candidatus Nanoarchaeia archaeon]
MVKLMNFLSKNYCSQRIAKEWIDDGRITVNGKTGTWMQEVDPKKDIVKHKNIVIKDQREAVIIMNKPKGYVVTSLENKNGENSIYKILKVDQRVVPVGRLDRLSEGLILFTNNGELAQRLMRPEYNIERTYIVYVIGQLSNERIKDIKQKGVDIGGHISKPKQFSLIEKSKQGRNIISELKIILTEGKNREIRKMLDILGLRVIKLERINYANIKLGGLKEKRYRYLNRKEIEELKKMVKMDNHESDDSFENSSNDSFD